jgi:PEP-CTERM motif
MKTNCNSSRRPLGQAFSMLLLASLFIGFVGTAQKSSAQLVADYSFDSLTVGSALPTTYPVVDTYPQHTVYAVGGYPNDLDPSVSNPLTGSVTVQNVGTMSKAALMSTTQAGTGALYIDTQMMVAGPTLSLSFDIDVVTTPVTGLPQGGVGAPNGQAFALQVFGLDSQRLLRFAVSPTSATGGDFGYRLPGASGDLVSFGSYTDGDTHHVDINADFSTSLMNISLDGVQVVTGAALVNPGTGVSEVFMFQNGVDGQANQVALDNIVVAVPEPATLTLVGASLIGLLMASRHRKA